MYRIIVCALLLVLGASQSTFAQLQIPALSPSGEITQTIGLTEISISYSRPSVKGRSIFGETGLIRTGDIWRTGANSATKLTLSDPIVIGSTKVEAGSYAMLTKPQKSKWELYLYPYESTNWSSYVDQVPVATIVGTSTSKAAAVETFTINIDAIELEKATLSLSWEHTVVSFPIQVEVQKRVMAKLDRVMEGPSQNDYFQAALFLHETNTDLHRALEYIQKVTRSEKALFFQVYREALILSDLRKTKQAIAAAQRSKALSEKAKNQDFVRLNNELLKKLGK